MFSTALPAIATITSPANACETRELVDRRLQRVDEPVGDERRRRRRRRREQRRASDASARRGARRAAPRCSPARLARRRVRAQVRDDPRDVDDQQADRADRRDRLDVAAAPGRASRRERPSSTMMNTVTSSSVAVSRGRRLEKRMTPSVRAARADHDHEAEHEQRVGEDRADDRRLRDDELALLQREDHDEQLGQVAERRLQQPRRRPARSARRAARSRTRRSTPGPASATRREQRTRGTAAQPAVVGDAGQRGERARSPPARRARSATLRARIARGRCRAASVALEHAVDRGRTRAPARR